MWFLESNGCSYLDQLWWIYEKLTMEFDWEREHIQLQGEKQLSQQVSMNQLRKLQHTRVISFMFHITMMTNQVHDCQQALQEDIHQLLTEFEDVFAEPTTLPPHRQLDHEIHLIPNSTPVNVRPYRYPHFQKNEIEK